MWPRAAVRASAARAKPRLAWAAGPLRWLALSVAAGALCAVSASAKQAVTWIESYEEALAEARRTGKPIFLEFRCAP